MILKLSFDVDEVDAKSWVEDTLKKLSNKDGLVGPTIMDGLMKSFTLHHRTSRLLSMARSHQSTRND